MRVPVALPRRPFHVGGYSTQGGIPGPSDDSVREPERRWGGGPRRAHRVPLQGSAGQAAGEGGQPARWATEAAGQAPGGGGLRRLAERRWNRAASLPPHPACRGSAPQSPDRGAGAAPAPAPGPREPPPPGGGRPHRGSAQRRAPLLPPPRGLQPAGRGGAGGRGARPGSGAQGGGGRARGGCAGFRVAAGAGAGGRRGALPRLPFAALRRGFGRVAFVPCLHRGA